MDDPRVCRPSVVTLGSSSAVTRSGHPRAPRYMTLKCNRRRVCAKRAASFLIYLVMLLPERPSERGEVQRRERLIMPLREIGIWGWHYEFERRNFAWRGIRRLRLRCVIATRNATPYGVLLTDLRSSLRRSSIVIERSLSRDASANMIASRQTSVAPCKAT